jgi:uncharacterized coiled-coil protein SlyX
LYAILKETFGDRYVYAGLGTKLGIDVAQSTVIRLLPQVIAVKLQEIERNQNDLRVVTAMPQLVKARHSTLVAAHRLAVDQTAAHFSLFTARTMSG